VIGMPDVVEWVNLYNPSQQAWHRVPNHPVVIQDFQDRGWETPEDSAARAKDDASQLHGKELEDALDEAGLSKSGTVKEKQKRLAEHRAEQVTPTEESAIAEETEGEQV
jgi:hypothetical protein